MFLDGLDELDQKIVQLLIENARMSYSEIGQQVGISRVAVKTRILSLEKRGVIEEYTAIINPQKMNGAVSCYFEIETSPETFAQVTEILSSHETVSYTHLDDRPVEWLFGGTDRDTAIDRHADDAGGWTRDRRIDRKREDPYDLLQAILLYWFRVAAWASGFYIFGGGPWGPCMAAP